MSLLSTKEFNLTQNFEEQDQIQICYGHIIGISQLNSSEEYIFSDGFVNNNLYLKSQNEEDFQQNLFQIFPSFSNSSKQDVQNFFQHLDQRVKELKTYQSVDLETNTYENNYSPKECKQQFLRKEKYIEEILNSIPNYKNKILDFKSRINGEYQFNIDIYERFKNTQVKFGEQIQLIHLASNKFLSHSSQESEFEKENFKVFLSDYPNENTTFKLYPAFKYQEDGLQNVYQNDSIKIIGFNIQLHKQVMLHASEQVHFKTHKQIENLSFKSQDQNKKDFNQQQRDKKREINASLEDFTIWKLNFYSFAPESDKQNLRCGDIFWVSHSELNATLTASKKREKSKKIKGQDHEQNTKNKMKLKFLRNQKQQKSDGFKGNIFAMWQIENQNYKQGGNVQFKSNYRLKHISSGFYLAVYKLSKNSKKNQENQNLILIKKPDQSDIQALLRFEKNTLFKFYPTKTTSSQKLKDIKKDSFIYIFHVSSQKFLDAQIQTQFDLNINQINQDQNIQQLSLQIVPQLSEKITEQESFKIFYVNPIDSWEINFLINSFPILSKFLNSVQDFKLIDLNQIKKIESQIKEVSICLIQLESFLCNKLVAISNEQKFGQINKSRQNSMKEQYYIEVLMEILKEILKKSEMEMFVKLNTEEFKEQRQRHKQNLNMTRKKNLKNQLKLQGKQENSQNQKQQNRVDNYRLFDFIQKKVELCELIYSLVEKICQDNNENEQYTFGFLPYFQYHAKYFPNATKLIIKIVNHNYYLLQKLTEDIRIKVDDSDQQIAKNQFSKVINIMINLKDNQDQDDPSQNFKWAEVNDKLTSKPKNLISYFINLLWDQEANQIPMYIKFLRAICRFKNKAVSQNQEIIFKFLIN